MILARWGNWPNWTPVLIHTLAANHDFDFLLVSDVHPDVHMPANVRFVNCTFKELLRRCQDRLGARLPAISAPSGDTFRSGVSSEKVNDLKPMFGELFAEELAGYTWWGHMQAVLYVS
eukprot:4247522-Pleurochrysis_carterae.AAC.5